jgi:tetratricopeptide (TPR) repeat protein
MTRHLWVTEPIATPSRPLLARIDAHRRRRGPYTAAGSLFRSLGLDAQLVARHDVELATVAPELHIRCARETLTSLAPPEERTRFYPAERTQRIAHGLTELLIDAVADGRALVLERMDDADPTDVEWVVTMLRRVDPDHLQLVVCTAADPPSELGDALLRYADRHTGTPQTIRIGDAAAHVASECTDAGSEPAYRELTAGERAALHDARADELEACGEASLRLGAIPFHRERGSDPEQARVAVLHALQQCMLMGFYDAVEDLAARSLALLDWDAQPEECWKVTSKLTTVLAAMGRPDEAEELYDRACANTTSPKIHLHAAYGRAMLYARFLPSERRDRLKAKSWINTAIALAGQLPDAQRRAFMLSFHENGLALIETYLGEPQRALDLVDAGLARIEIEGADPGTSLLLHRSVLRYNRAQLLSRMGRLDEALIAYDEAIAADPNQSEYHLERAHLLRQLGHPLDALAGYEEAIRTSPPYAQPRHARADLLLALGEEHEALAGFSRALELEPDLLDARIARASLLVEHGELSAALVEIGTGLDLAPASAELHTLRGSIAHDQARFDDAHAAYAEAVRCDPTCAAAWSNRARLWFEQGDTERAIVDLDTALDLDDDPDIRANLELALAARSRACASV